ncbi:MAG: LPS export ABC transporter permease LptF [Acidobacteria bacterium]|nr:MAG: LPS export ABC transporter permease LptF [Acidobacteriota bacterium]
MRILTRYILREIASHSLLGLLIFSFVIYIKHLGYVLELVVRHDLLLLKILSVFALPLPAILVLTIPMALLVGTLIGLSRMAADGEVIAVRASGIGLAQFVLPVMLYALLGWGLAGWMSLSLAPAAGRELVHMQASLKASQIPYEIRPKVFVEQFPNKLLYLQDVTGAHSRWRGVFIADNTQRDAPQVTLAASGILTNNSRSRAPSQSLTLHLERGATHETDPEHPEQYSVASFTETDIPIPFDQSSATGPERLTPSLMPLGALVELTRDPGQRRAALVELNYRLALPMASLVLALVGIPLGLFHRKGGKAVGVILTILLVFIYYILMAFGWSFAKQGRLDPTVGLWTANAVFAVAGILMLAAMPRVRARLQLAPDWILDWIENLARRARVTVKRRRRRSRRTSDKALLKPRAPGSRLLQILDGYVIRDWLFYLGVMVLAFTGVYVIFDFFQLLGDIIRNHASAAVVLNYYRFLIPQVLFFPVLPLSVLVATLVSFGLLTRTNQITAIKAAGISLYRIAVPVFIAAAVLSAGMFVLEDGYLPALNQRQDAYRNQIKGRPAQTYLRPDRQWIFGQSSRIYNYRFFDPDRNVFANLSVFEFDPAKFQMTRRVYAGRAFWEDHIQGWVLEDGWVRDLAGDRVASYMPFSVATFKELNEEPPYFKKEVKTSEQMSVRELGRYINELAQSGFDVVRLSVQFYRKFSLPLVAFVVALIGVPFSLQGGAKGAVSGFALSILIAVAYWSVSSLFEAMGNLHQLPPVVAAWSPDVFFGLGGVYLLLRIPT